MIKPLYFIVFSALVAGAPLSTASALTDSQVRQCKAMGASIKARQNELIERGEARTAKAEAVELSGEAWEAAEALRNFGAQQAAEADAAESEYQTLKTEFSRQDMAYQSDVAMLNKDVAAFNGMCLPKKN